MDFIQALILGIVEGITEFLPISSTGHLILATDLLQISQTEFVKSFTVIIQSGAILAVLLLYWRELISKKSLMLKVLVAFLPTAVIGLLLYKVIKEFLLGNTAVVLWSMFLGGIALLLLELFFKHRVGNQKLEVSSEKLVAITYKQSFLIGIFQSISVVPGTSRALASIFGGMIVGLSRKQAVEFSFLLAAPTLLAATGLDLLETSFSFNNQEWTMLGIGFVTSFIVAYLVIKWFIKYISHHTFIIFGIYRIIAALLLYLFLMR